MSTFFRATQKTSVFLMLIAVSILTCSCKSALDKAVGPAVRDGVVTQEEWHTIADVAKNNKGYTTEDAGLNVEKLKQYVSDYAKKHRRNLEELEFEVDISAYSQSGDLTKNDNQIVFKFFLERSGSMIPYDDRKNAGQFKDAIITLLGNVPNNGDSRNLMFVVNNEVTVFKKTFKDFVQSGNIMEDTKGYGDPSNTDFSRIFDSVLNRTSDNEVSILVSDLIYSTPDHKNLNAQRILSAALALSKECFKGHEDKDILIIKLNADYNGKYYPYNSPNKGYQYDGQRPYYMMIVAKSPVMQRLFLEKKYNDFCNFKDLNGYENYYCFTRHNENPDYSILFKNSSRFAAEKGQKQIHNIKNLERDRHSGECTLTIAVDMSHIIAEPQYLTDPDNYDVQSRSGFAITEITPIDTEKPSTDISHYVPTATHLITLSSSENLCNDQLVVSLKNKFPSWIEKSSTDDDTNPKHPNFKTTTFAFKSMMEGIYQAFYSTSQEHQYYYSLTFNIKKK